MQGQTTVQAPPPEVQPDLTRPDRASLILEKAADYIEQHGWCQGGTGLRGESRCVVRAISYVGSGGPLYVACERLAGVVNWEDWRTLPDWNDTPGRTKEQVVRALREASTL